MQKKYWSGKQDKNEKKKRKKAFSFPKETREGQSLYLTPSLAYTPQVGIDFYMNDKIIQSKANSGNKRFPQGFRA